MIINSQQLVFIFTLFFLTASAQSVSVKTSETIESRNGHNYYLHQVDKGQTVYSIAKAYHVTVDEIYFENPSAKNGLNIGQQLLIPTVNKETQLNTEVKTTNYEFFYHIASANETLKHISTIYVIPVEYIRKANPTLHDPLREGEYVKVPVEESFNALDGKTNAQNNVVTTPPYTIPIPVKRPEKKQESAVASNQPVRQKQTETPTAKNTTQKPAPPAKNTGSEFVTFDPGIPVIDDYRHVTIMGETTQSIADKYDIPIDVLKAANPGLGNTVIKGDRLRVPDKTKLTTPEPRLEQPQIETPNLTAVQEEEKKFPPTDTTKTQEPDIVKHVVKKQETLYGIGREYGVTVNEILAVNKGLTPNILIGQTINIPKKKINRQFIEHRVTSKTKLKNIARLYQVDKNELEVANPALDRWVYSGQIVRIPVGESALLFTYQPIEPRPIPDKPDEIDIPFSPEKSNVCLKNQPHFNRVFKLALMLPLYLEDMDSLNIDRFLQEQQTSFKPFRFIGFYEGALIALDSLKKQGLQVELFVYDVDQSLSKATKVLKHPELREMDLIIGPLFPECFHQVALFAGNFNIPIVNPLTFREETAQNYKTAIKVKPGIASQNKQLASYLHTAYPDAKVFFITQNAYEEAVQVQNMINALRESNPDTYRVSNTDLYNLAVRIAMNKDHFSPGQTPPVFKFEGQNIYPDLLEQMLSDSTTLQNSLTRVEYQSDNLAPLLNNASVLRPNVVVLYGNKKSFVLDVLNQLNEIRDTLNIKLFGVPTWERLSDLNNTQLSNLNLTYFSSGYTDYELPEIQHFIWEFRQRYSTEPDTYAYLGFDLTYYFMNNLFLFDDQFYDCLENNPMHMLQSTYHFERQYQNSFENTFWNLLQYKNLNQYKVQDSIVTPSNNLEE
ncbi:MAG: hypothetical protein CVT99_10810 [Bacteroidetes bacterium HGW-Bacteroidetes-16]|jgi:LysM repeat protein|nr:MAG: hypothetical protein CVT99_10810 [Bacteroidetes bacterium HGW-Bacteroidetes-16]